MPGGDRTGPAGMGPMTGRGAGYCTGYDAPGFVSRPSGGWFGAGRGRGFGFGRGRGFGGGGRGFRHMYLATGLPGWMRSGWGAAPGMYRDPGPEEEKQYLQRQAEDLQAELEDIRKRLEQIEAGSSSE